MVTQDPHPSRETRMGCLFKYHDPFKYHDHSWVLHHHYVTLSLIHISHLIPTLTLKQYLKSRPNLLIAQNRDPGDFSGSDQCHKTSSLQK